MDNSETILTNDSLSFIKVRDPSIIWYRPFIDPNIRTDLFPMLEESDTKLTNSSTQESNYLKVYLRIKPSTDFHELYEVTNNLLICNIPNDSYLHRKVKENNVKKQFTFSKVYGPNVTQTYLFNDSVKKSVFDFINGQNSTLFSYGASGSGKTYTMLGTADEPGVIPRALEYIFRALNEIEVKEIPELKPISSGSIVELDETMIKSEINVRNMLLSSFTANNSKTIHEQTYRSMQARLSTEPKAQLAINTNVSVSLWVSFAELYNEYIYDLLSTDQPRKKQRQKLQLGLDSSGCTIIKDLTHVHISSGIQAYQLLQHGMQCLNYASTSVNPHSSRSHCIFTIKLLQVMPDKNKIQINHFNFCDLAGSERMKNTSNIGERLKESNNINTSLHVLGRCIKSIQEGQKSKDSKIIPYRDSKLTRLFQPALSGNESIAIIININADRSVFDESYHVLNFSSTAQDILVNSTFKSHIINGKMAKKVQKIGHVLTNIEQSFSCSLEVNMLRNKVIYLSHEVDSLNKLLEEQEKEIRTEIVESYQKFMQQESDSQETEMIEFKKDIMENYNKKCEELEKKYKNETIRGAKRQRVIDLISSDEEEDEIQELQKKIKNFEQRITELKNENIELKSKLKPRKDIALSPIV